MRYTVWEAAASETWDLCTTHSLAYARRCVEAGKAARPDHAFGIDETIGGRLVMKVTTSNREYTLYVGFDWNLNAVPGSQWLETYRDASARDPFVVSYVEYDAWV